MNFLTASVKIDIDDRGIKSQLARVKSAVTRTVRGITSAFKRMGTAFKAAFTKMARYAKWAALAIVAFGAAAVKLAMDMQDSEDFFDMAMGRMSKSTRKWSNELADALFLNRYELRETVAVFNEMTTAMGMEDEAASKLSQRYTKLAYDLLSYHPKVKTLEQASIVLQGALTGERETLKRLGYYYSENDVKLKSMAMGYGSNTQALTALQKLEVNDAILMEKMINVHGDLNRTIDQSKNVFRSLWNVIKETATGIGEKLLPAVTTVGIKMRDWFIANQAGIIEWSEVWVEKIEAVIRKLWNLINILTKDFKKGIGIIKEEVMVFGKALADSFIIIARSTAQGFARAFGEELGKFLFEWGKPDGVLGKISLAIPAIAVTRLALMEAGIGLIESARLEAPIRAVEQLSKAWENVGTAISKAASTPISMTTPGIFGGDAIEKIFSQSSEAIVDIHQETVDGMKGVDEEYKTHWSAYWEDLERISTDKLEVIGENAAHFATVSESHLSDALTDYWTKAKTWQEAMESLWQDVLRSFIRMIADMVAQAIMFAALKSALGLSGAAVSFGGVAIGGVSNLFDTNMPAPRGGFPGSSTITRAQEGGHVERTGLAIIHKGEDIIPANTSGGNIDVRMHNESSENLVVDRAESYMVSDQRIIDVYIKAADSNGPFRRSMRRRG